MQLKTVNGLADGTREWNNCFLAAARGLGFETSVLEPCVLVLRNTQQKYHGIVGVAVDDIAGGGDEVWEQAISKLKQRFTFGHCEVGKGRFCSREVVQAADRSMRDGQPAYIKSLDFVPLGKLRKEQSGDANLSEKTATRSVLGALGYLAHESRPDLSGPVSILQSRFHKAQVSDIQEKNSVVRLAKAHTDLVQPVCKIPLNQICFVSHGDASGGSTRAEQAQDGYVIMFADRAFLEGMAAPVTQVSWRSHRSKHVVTSASAAEAMGLPGAFAQSNLVRASWSEVVLGLNLREWREQQNMPPLVSVTDSKGKYDHINYETVGPSEDRKTAIDLTIIRKDLSRPRMFLRWVDGKAQVADTLTKLHGDGDLLRAVCRQAYTV